MLQRVRIGILSAVLSVLLLHFTMVWLYVNPFPGEPYKNFWGQWYCSPFFSQGWNLFVPTPRNNYLLFVEYTVNGERRQAELFRSLAMRHRNNRLTGNESLLIALTNSIHFFEHATTQRKTLNGPIESDLYFRIVRHAAKELTRSRCDCDPKDFKMMLYVDEPGEAARVYY